MSGPPRRLLGPIGPALSPDRIAFIGIFIVTGLGLVTIGATLPVLPKYVTGPLGSGDIAVGVVTGAFAATGLLFRPIGGAFADARGRKPVVVAGALITALSGALLFVPAGVGGLIVARLFLGAGEGMVYVAGAAWIVDMAPVARRGRVIGLYGLAIWGGLSLGPPIGELLLRATSFDGVWAFATIAPLVGALVASRIPESYVPLAAGRPNRRDRLRGLIARESLGPGAALTLTVFGYATLAAFIVLHLDERGIGHGALVFTTFAFTVVTVRIIGGGIPDRFGGTRSAAAAGAMQAGGLFVLAAAQSLAVALLGAALMGAGFALLFPSLALLVVDAVPEDRRGAAMGTFTAFFDIGVGVGAPLAGIAAGIGGYGLAFVMAGVFGLGTIALALRLGRNRLPGSPPKPASAETPAG
jgi:MFS family permease